MSKKDELNKQEKQYKPTQRMALRAARMNESQKKDEVRDATNKHIGKNKK